MVFDMNMITGLLGTTGLLLIVAVVLSVMRMNSGSNQSEVEQLKAEIAALEAQQQQLVPPSALNPALVVPNPTPAPVTPSVSGNPGPVPTIPAPAAPTIDPLPLPTPNPAASANPVVSVSDPNQGSTSVAEELREEERKWQELQDKNAKLEQENGVLRAEIEEGLVSKPMLESARKNKARASTVKAAFLQAKVVEWVPKDEEQQVGGFAVIEVHREDLQVGTILGIRRQSGIYGQMEVVKLYPDKGQAVADPIRGTFPDGGNPVIQPGDELIIPPL